MIQDHTIDQTLIELARTMKALKALRAARKAVKYVCSNPNCSMYMEYLSKTPIKCKCGWFGWTTSRIGTQHAAATRASMDLTRKLADLRQGR